MFKRKRAPQINERPRAETFEPRDQSKRLAYTQIARALEICGGRTSELPRGIYIVDAGAVEWMCDHFNQRISIILDQGYIRHLSVPDLEKADGYRELYFVTSHPTQMARWFESDEYLHYLDTYIWSESPDDEQMREEMVHMVQSLQSPNEVDYFPPENTVDDESSIERARSLAYAVGLDVPEIENTVHLISQSLLEEICRWQRTSIDALTKRGNIKRAYRGNQARDHKDWPHYFVAHSEGYLREKDTSSTCNAWIEKSGLKKFLLTQFGERAQTRLNKIHRANELFTVLFQHGIIDHTQLRTLELCSTYLVSSKELNQLSDGLWDLQRDLWASGYTIPCEPDIPHSQLRPHRSRFYLFFPADPKQGLAIRPTIHSHLEAKDYLTEARYQQIRKSSGWKDLQMVSQPHPELGTIRKATQPEITKLLEPYPPLSTNKLTRLGFILYGQISHPNPTQGHYLLLERPIADEVRNSKWYQDYIASR